MLYLDVWVKNTGSWQRISEDKLLNDGTEKFVTWQRYISEVEGEHGAIYGNLVADFDDATTPENARLDAVKLYDEWVNLGIKKENIRIYFSGKKGFHVELDYRAYMDKPVSNLHLIYKMFYREVKDHLKTLDRSIYSIRRQWRLVNTRHSGTGLFCVHITREELGKSLEAIKTLAKEPREFENIAIKDDIAKKYFEKQVSRYYKSVDEFQKRLTKIQLVDCNGIPPCITGELNQRGLTTMRNEILFHNACALKAIGKTQEEAMQIIEPFVVGNNYNRSDAEKTLTSAYSKDRYLSCEGNSPFCDKDICNALMNKEEAKEISQFKTRFGAISQEEAIYEVEQDIKNGCYLPVIKSGIEHIDIKCPIFKDHVLVVCGNSNEGKTSFLVTLMKNNPDKKCLFWSIEEGHKRASLRLNYAEYFTGKIQHVVCYDNEPITEEDIKTSIRIYKPDYVVIDQLINMEQNNRKTKEERLKYKVLMESLRRIARELVTPIIIAHQLNREAISEDIPIKEQIAEGADIERLAYDVWILFRRKVNNEYATFINIAKTKNFRSNVVIPVSFNPKTYTLQTYKGSITLEMEQKFGITEELLYETAREIKIKKDVPWN